jgi:hypothetical protein
MSSSAQAVYGDSAGLSSRSMSTGSMKIACTAQKPPEPLACPKTLVW